MALVSINPATGKRIRTHREHGPKAVAAALDHAHRAFLGWRETAPVHRARLLRRLGAAFRDQAEALARLVTAEMGKPLAEARAEAHKCADCCDHYAKHGPALLRPETPPGAPAGVEVCPEPLGVILAIMPWNFPLWQVVRAAVPALLAGNTVLLKHASNVTGCALALEKLFTDAGLPAGLLRTVVIPSSAVPALIADPRVRGVTLTGSTAAGRKVAALAGAALKPCVLELGGSDPYVILEDADIARAAEACATSRLINAGQSCVAAKRFIVVGAVRAAFEQAFLRALAARTCGDPADDATTLGPLARPDLRDELHAQVRASVRKGARLLLGGKVPAGPGNYYPPTLLTDVRPGMPAYDEELFGPVAAVIPVKDEAAALAAANATGYGLGAAIFSRRAGRAAELGRAGIDAGMVFVNDFVRSHPAVPFGGTKCSGIGRELGPAGVRAFVNAKTVWVA